MPKQPIHKRIFLWLIVGGVFLFVAFLIIGFFVNAYVYGIRGIFGNGTVMHFRRGLTITLRDSWFTRFLSFGNLLTWGTAPFAFLVILGGSSIKNFSKKIRYILYCLTAVFIITMLGSYLSFPFIILFRYIFHLG